MNCPHDIPETAPGGCRLCDREKRPLPGKLVQLANFAKAAAVHVADGMKQSPIELQVERMALCVACEFYRKSDQRCSKCACKCKTKASWLDSDCPVGKW